MGEQAYEVEASAEGTTEKKKFLKYLGPAVITAALVLGPGSLTLSSTIGAVYGYQLMWMVLMTVIFMMIFTEISTRIGIASDISFIEIARQRWGKILAVLIGLGSFLVTSAFQAGNAIGVGVASEAIFGGDARLWVFLFTVLAIFVLFAKNFYKVLERLMISLVIIMLFAFIFTTLIATPNLVEISKGFIPSIPDGSMGLIIGFTATCFSIVGASYQSYLVQEKELTIKDAKQGINESMVGIFLLGLISALVLILAAAVLRPQGLVVDSAAEMGQTLEPAFGTYALVIFMVGLFGASFSSILGNATIGGALFADGAGLGTKLSQFKVKLCIIAVMLFGSTVAIIFEGNPVDLIVFAQGVTIIAVPLIAIVMLVISNNREIMGELVNTWWKNAIAIAGLIVLILLAINNINTIFFS